MKCNGIRQVVNLGQRLLSSYGAFTSVLVFLDLSLVFVSVLKYKNGKQNPEVCETLEVRSPLLFGGQDSCSIFCFKDTVY